MNRKVMAALLLTVSAASFDGAPSIANSLPQPSYSNVFDLKLSDLRSAYLIRAGVVRYDANAHSPDEIRAQLQRHFDVMIGLLLVSTPRSIDMAIARLEAADNHTWSAAERSSWRQELLAMRCVQLRRLAEYRDRGLFPLNEGQPQPVPIFVDAHDTACAVGHLMRLAGWGPDVADIERINNLVYVPDAPDSAVAAWALTSGLTREEAALIQPGYGGFLAPYYAKDFEAGELSLIKNGLKYENFHFEALNYTSPFGDALEFHFLIDLCDGCFYSPTPGGLLPEFNNVGFNAGIGTLQGVTFFDNYDPIGTHWISLGGVLGAPTFSSRLIGGTSSSTRIQRILLSFDVSTTEPNTYINQIAEHSYPAYGGFGPLIGDDVSQYEFTTKASQSATLLGAVHFEEDYSLQPFTPRSAATGLSTQANHISVSTAIWLYKGATIDCYVLGFQVVPEPTGLLSMVAGVAIVGVSARRRL